jgi:predicted dehydrogenase
MVPGQFEPQRAAFDPYLNLIYVKAMGDPLQRVLLIGHGGMGQLYARSLKRRSALCGVGVGSAQSRDRLSEQLEVPVDNDLNRLIETTKPDGLAVLSPTDWHANHARLGIRMGLPTLIIKPATAHPDTARALYKEASEGEVPVMMAHEGCCSPAFRTIEAALHDGAIGDLKEIRWLKEGKDQLSGGREPDAIEEATEGRNLGYVYATGMHEIYVANRLAGHTAPTSVDLQHVRASMARPELDALFHYGPDLVLRLRYDGDPDRPFRRGLQLVGTKGGLLWLVQPGKTQIELRTRGGKQDLPYYGTSSENPADPVVDRFLDVATIPEAQRSKEAGHLENLMDGAQALEGARMLTLAAAQFLSLDVDLDGIAGGTDRS